LIELNSQSLTLNGTITGPGQLKGDLTGASLLVGGTTGGDLGTVNFLSGAQTLSTLTVNRTGASASVTLGSNLTVGGTTTLTNGVVNMGTSTTSRPAEQMRNVAKRNASILRRLSSFRLSSNRLGTWSIERTRRLTEICRTHRCRSNSTSSNPTRRPLATA